MFHISLRYRELCQEDAVLLGNKMKSPVNQNCCFLLFMLCYKDMQHRSKHHPIVERGATGQNWIPFLFDIHWFHILLYFIAKVAALQHISTKLNFPSWLRGLLSGPCSWICTVYTQDLKPKVRIYIYIACSLIASQLVRLKTKTNINKCLKWLIFYIIQCTKLTKKHTPTKTRTLFFWRLQVCSSPVTHW